MTPRPNSSTSPLRPGLSIGTRTALLSWLVTIATLLLFATAIIPQQKVFLLKSLESKARGVAVSLHQAAAGAAVNEDFGSVVDRCKEMLDGDPALDYLVVTRNDGFSLIHDRRGWRSETSAGPAWRPTERAVTSGIGVVTSLERRVFHYSQPFDYTGIQWGWIHVGLTLETYDANVSQIYRRTAWIAVLCMALGLAASVLYAKRLVLPILSLRTVVRLVAGGDLSARAAVEGRDEIGVLASSVNAMTEALLRRDEILQSVQLAAQRFLSTSAWSSVVQEVLVRMGEAAQVGRICVFESDVGADGTPRLFRRFEWTSQGIQPEVAGSVQHAIPHADVAGWVEAFRRAEAVESSAPEWTDAERAVLAPWGAHSLLLTPIQVDGSWWGFLGLVDCEGVRQWTSAERGSLRAATDMLGAAISRQRAQDALLAAKEAAEAASRAKSQFLANMSHEIRTPINGVMGMLRLLQRTPLDEKQRRYLTNTLTSADTLLKVIGDVLDFSKIEAGKLDLEETVFSPADTLDVALELLAERAEAKGLELACRVGDGLPRLVIGDPGRLQQVLVNLLSNAIKFTDRGAVVLSCDLEPSAEGDPVLRFEVQDTGSGIPVQQQAMIFDAFFQADNSMSRVHGGTGLGLTICRQIVSLMGGQIGLRSAPAQGSTFWFTARFRGAAPADRAGLTTAADDFRGLRVLVVDDSPEVREILCGYVRAWKGLPESAPDAGVALELLRRAAARGDPFSVAVLDAKMQSLSGLDLARLIKLEPALRRTGLILLASFSQADAPADVGDGFDAWLTKPVRRSEIFDAIVRAARGGGAHAPGTVREAARPSGMAGEVAAVHGAVVLAEDNEINQDVARELLLALGYRCTVVCNGREAVKRVQEGLADLVLMDCQMPEMDGYEATRVIRSWEQEPAADGRTRRRVPIVALTAHAMKGDRARCLEAGMDDYLTKPLEPAELERTLGRWLPRPEGTGGQVQAPAAASAAAPAGQGGIDLPSLLRRCLGRQDLAARLVDKFLAQAKADAKEMEAAIRTQDGSRLALVAHRIKGAAANVSAESVRECARGLEALGKEGDLGRAPELHAQLMLHLEAVVAPATASGPRASP